MKPHYYVLRVGHKHPTVRHATPALAAAEAERLAAQHPGDTFEVLQCLAITRTAAPVTFWLDGCGPEPTASEWTFDWSKVPEGFPYPAMDADGRWAAFKHHPDKDHKEWGPEVIGRGIGYQRFDHPPFPGDWKDSLQIRPDKVTPPPPEPGYIEITDPEEIIREGDEFTTKGSLLNWRPCGQYSIGYPRKRNPHCDFRRPDPTRQVVPVPEEYLPLPPLPEGKTQWVGRGRFKGANYEAGDREVRFWSAVSEWWGTQWFSMEAFHIEAV